MQILTNGADPSVENTDTFHRCINKSIKNQISSTQSGGYSVDLKVKYR